MSRFDFKTKRFSILDHQVSSPSSGYLFCWRHDKRKSFYPPSKRKQPIFKKNIYAVHIDPKLVYAFKLVLMSTRLRVFIPDSTKLVMTFCFRKHSINFAVSRFVFKPRRFPFLHHHVFSPSAGYLVRWRDGKNKCYCFPSKRKRHIFKSHLCCASYSQVWLCIQPCFIVYVGYKIIFQNRPHFLGFFVSLHFS